MPRPPLAIRVEPTRVVLEGAIDEHAKLDDLLRHAQKGRLVLDLAGITFISSIGVREWILMQRAAAEANLRIELRRVAEPLIHQLNIVRSTRGVSIVTSFYAPYLCTECDSERSCLIEVATHGKLLAKLQAPELRCTECNEPMKLADPPELYFAFLAGS